MSETLTLPVLPLDDEVVLPGMVVPLETSTAGGWRRDRRRPEPSRQVPGIRSEAKAAGAARAAAGRSRARRRRHARRGRAGRAAARRRARRGGPRRRQGEDRLRYDRPRRGAVGRGHRDRGDRAGPARRRTGQGVQGPRHRVLQQRGAWQVIDAIQQIDDPSAIADRSGYSSYLLDRAEGADAGDRRPGRAAGAGGRLGPGAPRRAGRRRDDPQGRLRGRGEAAEGVPAAPAARRGPQGAGRADRRRQGHRGGRLPGPRGGRRPAGEGPRGRAEGGRQAGADLRAVARGRLDPDLARHRPRHPVERADRGRVRHRGRAG